MCKLSVRFQLTPAVLLIAMAAALTGCSQADDASAKQVYDDIIKERDSMVTILDGIKKVEDVDRALTQLEDLKDRLVALVLKGKDLKITKSFKQKMDAEQAAGMVEYRQKLEPVIERLVEDPNLKDAFVTRVMPKLQQLEAALRAEAR